MILIEKYSPKKCTGCEKIYPATLDFFYKNSSVKSKLTATCKICRTKYYANNKKWYDENFKDIKDKINERHRKRYHNTKNYQIKRSKKYRTEHKAELNNKRRIYQKHKRANDCLYKLKGNIRSLITISFKEYNFTKTSKTGEILGCTFEEFKIHIENQFKPWMSWENHGKYNGEYNFGWDFDHIIPLDSAITEEDIVRLNHYTNFQPLCSKINRYEKRHFKIL